MNECWIKGKVPAQRKKVMIMLIPKPGKKLGIDDLRLISLTSCVGKLLEHAILHRVDNFLEDNNIYLDTMIGFRKNLSTQDAMLQLKHQVIDHKTHSTRAILGLDLKKAFDNANHAAILKNIERIGLGQQTYNYIKSFLSDRKTVISVGGLKSHEIDIGGAGTPQGSVPSPMLFNLIFIGLPEKLNEIESLHRSIDADDITIWVCDGSDGSIQQRLKTAIDTVEGPLIGTGLTCSAEKYELLLYCPTLRGRPSNGYNRNEAYKEIKVYTRDGRSIPIVNQLKVLGLVIENKRTNRETIRKLDTKVTNTMRLIK